jgi:hypothetical protein
MPSAAPNAITLHAVLLSSYRGCVPEVGGVSISALTAKRQRLYLL